MKRALAILVFFCAAPAYAQYTNPFLGGSVLNPIQLPAGTEDVKAIGFTANPDMGCYNFTGTEYFECGSAGAAAAINRGYFSVNSSGNTSLVSQLAAGSATNVRVFLDAASDLIRFDVDNTERGRVSPTTTNFTIDGTSADTTLDIADQADDDVLVINNNGGTSTLTLDYSLSNTQPWFTIEATDGTSTALTRTYSDRLEYTVGVVGFRAYDITTGASDYIDLDAGDSERKHSDSFGLADNTKEDVFLLVISNSQAVTGRIEYSVNHTTTSIQAVHEIINFACVNAADTEVCDVNVVDTATAVSGGTITCTFGIDVDETNAVMGHLTCDNSPNAAMNARMFITQHGSQGTNLTWQQ